MEGSERVTFFIQLAGRTIEIHALFDKVQSMVRDYLTDAQTPDFVVDITETDIQAEGTASTSQHRASLESLAVYRKIAEQMLAYHTFLMHGAVVALDGKAYLFAAPSGTGKSTHVRKWADQLPEAFIVNGDKPLIIVDDQPMVCGTPWAGKENWHTNTMVPLAAIILMERGEDNQMRQITFSEAFAGLFRQTYQPKDKDKLKTTLHLLKALDHKVKFYSFMFNNMKDDAFQVAYHTLTGKQLPSE